ncbi:hypothetical protein F0562_015015 [Nyssa sinensis]|uniref:Late embryogenesis abundant protein LEA-2 subgroup domain-containing protein n=1 Tax=Nyssa sinensis TaxID=561372 RepID=A0A5J4ZP91_9ASTE|nr:hypothetical protein F0562_015015 [Nyssa sinensis]
MNQEAQSVLQKPPGYRDPSAPVKIPARPPPRKPVLPPSLRPEKKRRSCCCLCCSCFCIVILVLLFVIIVCGGVFYIWYEPRLPVIHLKSLQFPRFNVTVKPDGGTYLDSQTVLRVEVRNANPELRLIYDRTKVWLSAENTDLGSASLPAFIQEKKNITVLKLRTQVKNELIDDRAGAKLKAGFRSKRMVVSAEIRTGVGFGSGGWNTKKVEVKVLCGGVRLMQINGGVMPKCSINMLQWSNINL